MFLSSIVAPFISRPRARGKLRPFTGLRARLTLALVAAACLPTILIEVAAFHRAEEIVVNDALLQQELRAQARARDVNKFLQAHLDVITTIASRLDPSELAPETQRAL